MITPLNGALGKIKSEFDSLVKQEQDKLEDDSATLLSRYFYFFCW
jgi:hypothetical protein